MQDFNPFSLKDKNILVTGASSGIGQAIAIMCSKMGAKIIATGRNTDRLNETLNLMEGETNRSISADLTLEEDILKLVHECEMLDGVVHAAGIANRVLTRMINEEEISNLLNSNFKGPVLLQKTLLRQKKIKRGASIVFVASRAAFAPAVGFSVYAASKGALIAYAKVLALELSERLIRVNCICPGLVQTELLSRDSEQTGIDYETIGENYPLKRLGEPNDVAALAVYLLSDAASWMTGCNLDLTGGGELILK